MIEKEYLLRIITHSNSESELLDIVRKYLIHGTPYVFNNRENEYFEFRNLIAQHFMGTSFYEVFIMGSAKLGYSYHKDSVFSYDSDIDVAIVNPMLFYQYANAVRSFQYACEAGGISMFQRERDDYHKFLEYMIKGWMRPDKLPWKGCGELKTDWFDFFKSISNGKSVVGNYQVSAALFRDYTSLEIYYMESLKRIKISKI